MPTLRAPIEYEGHTYYVEYDPAALHDATMRDLLSRIRVMPDGPEKLRLYCEAVARVVVGWGIGGVDGGPLPVTEDALYDEIPRDLLPLIIKTLRKNLRAQARRSARGSTPPKSKCRKRGRR